VRPAHPPIRSAAPASPRKQGATPLSKPGVRRLVAVGLALAGISLLAFISGARIERMDIGHVGVVRNGGPFEGRSIRQVLMPGTGPTWAGWFSQKPHEYPSHAVVLLYTVTAQPTRGDRAGVDVVTVPTQDGVRVGIEGTVYYHFSGEQNLQLLRQFDKTFGTRKYSANGGKAVYPYEGDYGFQVMVENVIRPVLDNDLRRVIGTFQCAQLVSACSFVRPVSGSATRRNPNGNMALIESRINRSLGGDVAGALGGDYFTGVHFRLTRVTLPQTVQDAVTRAQAEAAQVHVAKQKLQQGRYEARRVDLLAKAYNKSPSLAAIEAVKAAPRQATVVINTNRQSQPLLVGAK
jgi:regulator of protease activity HflC (stomatin/prohibitin superfamily)